MTVKLRDKRKLKGYVSQINDDGFVITNKDNGLVTDVPYSQVSKLNRNDRWHSTMVIIATAAVALVVVALVAAVTADDF